MHLRTLDLEEFRSYHSLHLDLDPRGLRLYGANTSGKSTLLEAIAMLATTRSPRSTSEREVINFRSGDEFGYPPYARFQGTVERAAEPVEIEIALQTDQERAGQLRKLIKLDGRSVRAMDAVGILKAVLFAPEDVSLVAGAPSGRRRYLDLTISQLDGHYLRALSRYNRVLSQRNSLLKSLSRERVAPDSDTAVAQLAFWDEELVAFGSAIVAHRARVVRRLAELAHARFAWLTGGGELAINYEPSLGLANLPRLAEMASAADAQAVVARDYVEALKAARRDELRRGVSLLGPHRDELTFAVNGADLATYGSRGQQRLAVVALKLAEADLMTEAAGEPPVLLLDDVLSELDANHRALLTTTVAGLGSQVIVTATDKALLESSDLASLPMAQVEGGAVLASSVSG